MRFIIELGIKEGPDPDPAATAADIERFVEFCRCEFGFRSTQDEGTGYVASVSVEPAP